MPVASGPAPREPRATDLCRRDLAGHSSSPQWPIPSVGASATGHDSASADVPEEHSGSERTRVRGARRWGRLSLCGVRCLARRARRGGPRREPPSRASCRSTGPRRASSLCTRGRRPRSRCGTSGTSPASGSAPRRSRRWRSTGCRRWAWINGVRGRSQRARGRRTQAVPAPPSAAGSSQRGRASSR